MHAKNKVKQKNALLYYSEQYGAVEKSGCSDSAHVSS